MSYNWLTSMVDIPVFLPDTLLKLNVPEEMMNNAITVFNENLKKQSLDFRDGNRIKAKVQTLNRNGDDLFLRIRCFDDDGYVLDTLSAKMIGYVVMNKNTGEVSDLVIEGFQWVRKKRY